MKVYVTSDWHLGHKKMHEYCGRQYGYEELLFREWKNTATKDDVIINLGDLFFGDRHRWCYRYAALPGYKILVKGNHDNKSRMWYRNNFGFDEVYKDGVEYKHKDGLIIFTHHPVKLVDGQSLNIHGHFHNNLTPDDLPSYYKQNIHHLISVERELYKLVDVNDITNGRRLRGC